MLDRYGDTGRLLRKFVADVAPCFDDAAPEFLSKVVYVDFDSVGLSLGTIFKEEVSNSILREDLVTALKKNFQEIQFLGGEVYTGAIFEDAPGIRIKFHPLADCDHGAGRSLGAANESTNSGLQGIEVERLDHVVI